MKTITMRMSDDRGASMVEYGLLVGLIAIVAVVAVGSTGSATEEQFEVVAVGLGGEVDGGSGGVNQDPPGQEEDSQVEDNGDVSDGGNHDTAVESWDNEVSLHKGDYAGVLSVEVKVMSIRTSDEAWQTVSYPTDGPTTAINAPTAP